VSDQRLQTRGGERWPGYELCIGDAVQAPGGPSRVAGPGVPAARRRPLMAGKLKLPSEELEPSAWASTVESHGLQPRDERSTNRGRRGVNL